MIEQAIESLDERHLNTAVWMFPLYLLIINIFVLPIALAGQLEWPGDEVAYGIGKAEWFGAEGAGPAGRAGPAG